MAATYSELELGKAVSMRVDSAVLDDDEEVDDKKAEDSNIKTEAVEVQSNDEEGFGINYLLTFWTSVFLPEKPATTLATAHKYHSMGFLATTIADVDNFFRITDRESSFYREFTGGMTTFFSMAYIMVLNGVIIAGPFNTGMSVNGVFFATTLSAGIFTFMMGALVNVPVALGNLIICCSFVGCQTFKNLLYNVCHFVAPGMGLNGFFASIAPACRDNPTGDINGTPCPGWGDSSLPWSDAMGAVFLSGIIYLLFTAVGLRSMLFRAVSPSMRAAITVGIGFFITMIGIKIGQITRITLQPWSIGSIATSAQCTYITGTTDIAYCNNPVDVNFTFYDNGIVRFNENPAARIAVLGLALVAFLETMKVPGSIIIAIVLASFVGINYVHCNSMDQNNNCVTNLSEWGSPGGPSFIVDTKNIPSGKLTWKYANKPFFWDCVWTFLFVEMFDSFGTISGIMSRCGYFGGACVFYLNCV